MKASLAISGKNGPKYPEPTPETDKPKVTYPSICFRDEAFDGVKEALGEMPKLGDEVTVALTMKVTALRDDQYGKSVDFDVLSVDGKAVEEGDGDDEYEEKEEAPMAEVKGTKNPAVKKAMAAMNKK